MSQQHHTILIVGGGGAYTLKRTIRNEADLIHPGVFME